MCETLKLKNCEIKMGAIRVFAYWTAQTPERLVEITQNMWIILRYAKLEGERFLEFVQLTKFLKNSCCIKPSKSRTVGWLEGCVTRKRPESSPLSRMKKKTLRFRLHIIKFFWHWLWNFFLSNSHNLGIQYFEIKLSSMAVCRGKVGKEAPLNLYSVYLFAYTYM